MQQALVFASIVLGIAVAFELQHLNTLLRSKRVKWHWAQPLFAFFVLMTMMSFWWMIASGSAEEEITLARFLPIMWVLVILNLLAAAALPDRVPDEGIDLAAYYQENRRYLWGLYLLIFTPLAANWVSIGVMRSSSLHELLPYVMSELPPLAVIIFLFFARRWWMVALGYLGLAFLLVNWLGRSL
ncbi:hypothetical protein [Erythrobacter sp. EC-HK427]|uniref:hypothetical protein n=1 Tax=Erythrobacter sp. EC-HK427 TaxID=2038396 RepID=UPI0012550FC3|nr:hypothetical protein [Erythrobacter sp. EC-HK427]VVT19300.1 conserved membrane hypothetical protein [Erythrobacter sp. EC-HK427]